MCNYYIIIMAMNKTALRSRTTGDTRKQKHIDRILVHFSQFTVVEWTKLRISKM